jgi:hypothetical protein
MIEQKNINYVYSILSILGHNLEAKSIEMVLSAYELILQKGGKVDLDTILEMKKELSKKYYIGKK